MLYYIVCSIVPHFFIFVEKEASCLMQWKNAFFKIWISDRPADLKSLNTELCKCGLKFSEPQSWKFWSLRTDKTCQLLYRILPAGSFKVWMGSRIKTTVYPFLCFPEGWSAMIIGTVCLHDIRFAAYSCTEIGYKFDAAFRRMGYASEAIKKSCHLPFTTFIFIVYSHVLCRKTSPPSTFGISGFSVWRCRTRLFFIQNRWADHLRYAYLNPSTDN